MKYDVLIRGGKVVDGTGAAALQADVAIAGGKIAAVEADIEPGHARRTIDAEGLVVAPGFIDIKTHSDFTLPINPDATSKVRQGVTTEIIGHCGFSIAPVLEGKVDLLRDYLSPSAPWITYKETSFRQYLDAFPGTSVNAGMLVGHNTLRLMAMGMDQREPTEAELQHMEDMLEEGLEAGALGLSSGLFTSPGSYANTEEMHALGRVVKKHNAAYFTHLRDESNKVLDAVKEAIEFAQACDVHVEIVHFKCSGMDNWGKARTALEMIAAAKARGLKIDCDSHPYTAGSNPLKNLMPQWVQAGGVDAMLERIALPETRQRIRDDIARDGLNNWGTGYPSWDCVQISISPHLPQFAGRTIQSLADERGPGSDRRSVRLHDAGQGRDARACHIHFRGRYRAYRRYSVGIGWFGWKLRGPLRCHRPGHASPAFLRDLPTHLVPLCARTQAAVAGNGHTQNDRRHSRSAATAGPRPAAAGLCCRCSHLRSQRFRRPRNI